MTNGTVFHIHKFLYRYTYEKVAQISQMKITVWGLPLVMEILFYFLFHKMTDQFAMKYLAPGIVVFAQAFLCLFTGSLIATDRGTSFLTRLYVSKAKSHEFIFGYALSVLPWVVLPKASW